MSYLFPITILPHLPLSPPDPLFSPSSVSFSFIISSTSSGHFYLVVLYSPLPHPPNHIFSPSSASFSFIISSTSPVLVSLRGCSYDVRVPPSFPPSEPAMLRGTSDAYSLFSHSLYFSPSSAASLSLSVLVLHLFFKKKRKHTRHVAVLQ